MPIQVSPSVVVVEKDLTNIIPALATTAGGFAGTFQWGPANIPVGVDSEKVLVNFFGKPDNDTAVSFFTAANFLGYGNNLNVVRVVGTMAKNAVSMGTAVLIKNEDQYESQYSSGQGTVGIVAAKYAGILGNSIRVSYADADIFAGRYIQSITVVNGGTGYTATPTVTIDGDGVGATAVATVVDGSITQIVVTNTGTGYTTASVSLTGGTPTSVAVTDVVLASDNGGWEFSQLFSTAPGTSDFAASVGGSNDEMHIVVIDQDGKFTGTPGTVVETFAFVSKANDAKDSTGASIYYKKVLNTASKYVWWMDHFNSTVANIGFSATGTNFGKQAALVDIKLSGGVSDNILTDAIAQEGYSLFANDEAIDVSLIPLGGASPITATYVINNITESRKDCLAFISPRLDDVLNNVGSEADDIKATRNLLPSTSYAVMDSGWKYQYDRYNDVFRWIPLNGDIAGLCARTDFTNDPWFSPAGLNRGQIKNVVKLAYSPRMADRDKLYATGINPVVSFPGQGTVLYGDKTLLAKPSAFDRINVRRLFIVLEKAIATASKFILFELNDPFTRAQFKSLVDPFLRDVKGRRGLTDFLVVCDETNNTGEVIDGNRFIADIYLKPTRSINFVQLNFIATRTGVQFSEVVGA